MTNAATMTIKHEGLNLRKVTGRKAIAGDYVVYKRSHNGTPQGKPFKVESGGLRYNSETHQFAINGWGGSDQYDLYEAYEAPAFKVGDKVRVLSEGRYGDLRPGTEGVIEDIDSDYFAEAYRVYSHEEVDYDRFKAEDIELIPVELKKGDHVKILAISKYGLDYVGKTGVVDVVDFIGEGYTSVEPLDGGAIGLYLPEHLELIEQTELKTEEEIEMVKTFEVGDKVKVLNARNGRFADQVDGAIGVIDNIRGEGDVRTYRVSFGGDFDRYFAKDIELYVPSVKASRPLKEGDKVRLTSTNPRHGFGEVSTGDIGVVRSVYGDSVTVDFPAQSYWNGYAGEFELVGSDSTEVVTYETGDWVRILNKSKIAGNSDIKDGGVYEVIRGGDYIVIKDGGAPGNDWLSITPREQALIQLTDAPAKSAKKVGTDYDHHFAEGDTIRILDKSEIDGASDTTNGKTYEIIDVDWEDDISIIDDGGEQLVILRSEFEFIELVAADETSEFEQFQPGEKVVLLSDGGISPLWGYETGGEYFVKDNNETRSNGTRLIHIVRSMDSCGGGYAKPSQLRKVEVTKPASKFSVGDRVTFVEDTFGVYGGYSLPEGSREGTIKEVADGRGRSIYLVDIDNYRNSLNFTDDELMVEVTPVMTTKPELKEGDFIEIDFDFVDGVFSYLDLTKGKSYEVFNDEYRGLGFVDDIGDNRYAHIIEGAYKIVEAPTKPARKFQVGDIVRIDRKESEAYGSINEPGDIGEVTETSGSSTKVQVSSRTSCSNYELTSGLTLLVANENREDNK